MKNFIKLMILDTDNECLSPLIPAVYWRDVSIASFFRCIVPDLNSHWLPDRMSFFSNTSNTYLSGDDVLTRQEFEIAESRNTYFHLLAVNGCYQDVAGLIDGVHENVTKDRIRAFLTNKPPCILETIQKTATVKGIESNLPAFHSSAMVLMPLNRYNENTLCIKYADENEISLIYADLAYDHEKNLITMDHNSIEGNLFLNKDICGVDEHYVFGRIVDMTEQGEYLYVVHEKNDQEVELKTFHHEKPFQGEKQDSRHPDLIYRDTGNRILPFKIISGSRGEKSLQYRNILLKTLISSQHSSRYAETLPGKLYAMIKNEDGCYTILIWNHETRKAGIATISSILDLEKAAWLWFTCENQPKSLVFCRELDVFFLSMEGKGLLFMLENFQGSILREISTLFMDNEIEMAAKGDILDLVMGYFELPGGTTPHRSQPFLMVGQQTAISLYYFEETAFLQ
ncbi:MAG: hypothetical protein K9K40_13635 [Desulfotignum sp.]|nr:hypothetical protein [Desulfotignum sp.]